MEKRPFVNPRKYKYDVEQTVRTMIKENLSIRDMAKILGCSKGSLQYQLEKFKQTCENEMLLIEFELLLNSNTDNMAYKAVAVKKQKNTCKKDF